VKLSEVDASGLILGEDVDLSTHKLLDFYGAVEAKECRVILKRHPKDGGIVYEFELETTNFEGQWWEWSDDPGVSGQAQWADDDGKLADGSEGFRWV